ncbi:competence type IV pilus major pilin ComGC [Murimonas intestini]|uniref:competence type IV pilus major pilin ComGC n=1 Tax=Murimonas intestini TaxID=1337051 RepID=UPI0011DD873E|nr:prepilin-type N-terminal cleavage/methylation domain-containing protein [Murimonas intestini]
MIFSWKKLAKKEDGFTLVELIVVLVILALLSAVLVPSLLGFIDKSKEKVCLVNRNMIERYYRAEVIYAPDTKMQDMLDGNSVTGTDASELSCPSGGDYSVSSDGQHVVCSVHGGGDGESDDTVTKPEEKPDGEQGPGGNDGGLQPPDGSGAEKYPGTDIVVQESIWPTMDDFVNQNSWNIVMEPGGVFKHGENYYVITSQGNVDRDRVDKGPDAYLGERFVKKLTGKVLQGDFPLNSYEQGDIVDVNGTYYIWADYATPGSMPSEGAYGWYKIP